MEYSTCGGKDAVVGEKVERNEKGEVFCLPYKCHKLHSAITPRILAQFTQSKMYLKALKETF